MGGEARRTIDKYFDEDRKVQFYGNGDNVRIFADIFSNGVCYLDDNPDMLIYKDNKAIFIEHFEFDSYSSSKSKGSFYKREIARIERRYAAIKPTEEGVISHDTIQGQTSYINYIDNLKRVFDEHYSRISRYRENLCNKGLITEYMDVKSMFLIEDVSPLGSLVISQQNNDIKMHPILLSCNNEFLDIFQKSPRLDYVLACSETSNAKHVWFIDRRDIDVYRENSLDYRHMDFLDMTPHTLDYTVLIPDSYKK